MLAVRILILSLALLSCHKKVEKPYFMHPWGQIDESLYEKANNMDCKEKKCNKKVAKKTHKPINKNTRNLAKKTTKKKQKRQLVIGVSTPGSNSFRIAGIMCSFINKKSNEYKCVVSPITNGLENALRGNSEYDFIVSKSHSEMNLLKEKHSMSTMFSLYPESFTLIAKKGSKIKHYSDLIGKKVYLSTSLKAGKKALKDVMDLNGLDVNKIEIVKGVSMGLALCAGEIDAIFADIHHPNVDMDEFLKTCDANIIPVRSENVRTLVENHLEYIPADIGGGLYSKYSNDIKAFGVMINLLATSKVDKQTAYKITSLVFDHMQYFKNMDPFLLDLIPQQMINKKEGVVLDFHPGALQYYKQKKLL